MKRRSSFPPTSTAVSDSSTASIPLPVTTTNALIVNGDGNKLSSIRNAWNTLATRIKSDNSARIGEKASSTVPPDPATFVGAFSVAPTEPPGVNKVVVDVARDIYGQPVPPDLKRFLHPTANQATSAAINERRSSESPRLSVVSSEIERPRVASYGAFLSRTFTLRKIRFEDPDTERAFLRHMYHSLRLLAWGMLLVLIFNWILWIAFAHWKSGNMGLWDKIFYCGIAPSLLIAGFTCLWIDVRRTHPWIHDITMSLLLWSWGGYNITLLKLCGNIDRNHAVIYCPGREFYNVFMYSTSLPIVGLFAFSLRSECFAAIAVLNTGLLSSLVADRGSWIRNVLIQDSQYIIAFWVRRTWEVYQRKAFETALNQEHQTQILVQAQKNEQAEADSKRRFISYIFHEIRVPMNNASLAAESLAKDFQWPGNENENPLAVIIASLENMTRVINDVLDLNRMESGMYTTVFKPFQLHSLMQDVPATYRVDAERKKLKLCLDLDPHIDMVARTALLRAQRAPEEDITACLSGSGSDFAGSVAGDAIRLTQVLNNLVSNAIKFTPAGGTVSISTKLLTSGFGDNGVNEFRDDDYEQGCPIAEKSVGGISAARLAALSKDEWVIVRIEVKDTGAGIEESAIREKDLFSPYVQTDLGKRQGGKGTGLGLSLCKHIIQSAGGRLGLISQKGSGSTFWFELPFAIGLPVIDLADDSAKEAMLAESFARSLGKHDTAPVPSEVAESPVIEENLPDQVLTHSQSQHKGTRPKRISLPPPLSFVRDSSTAGEVARFGVPTPASAVTGSRSSPGSTPPATPLSVLAVDDDPITRMLMSRLLTRNGCHVETAENGEMALEALSVGTTSQAPSQLPDGFPSGEPSTRPLGAGRRYDIVFLDNQMPLLSGVEVVQQLRAAGRTEDYVVGVTGNALQDDQDEFIGAGANAVLTKPVKEADLKSHLQRARQCKRARESGPDLPG